jgi:plastocyanin
MSKTVTVFVILLAVAILLGAVIFMLNKDKANTNANVTTNTNSVANANRSANANANRAANTNATALNSNTNATSGTNTNAASNSNATQPSGSVSVSITDSGFTPKSLTVSAGQAVTWTNNDNVVHYVAPNDHPSHQRYSGIWDDDGSGRVGPGDTYRVTISTPGTYLYHDHLDSTLTGTLIVR